MTTPITSDLVGYQEFWTKWLLRLSIVGLLIVIELAALLWAVLRSR